MAEIKQCILIFLIGAVGYCALEMLWRGYTHPSMAVVGGLCLLVMCFLNRAFCDKPIFLRALLCAVAVSAIELASGLLLNVVLKLHVWDYSNLPFNLMGQVCPLYSMLWFFLSYTVLSVADKYFSWLSI